MLTRIIPARVDQVITLDTDLFSDGYALGFIGESEPVDLRVPYAYWYGWTRGSVEGGYRLPTPAETDLDSCLLAWRRAA